MKIKITVKSAMSRIYTAEYTHLGSWDKIVKKLNTIKWKWTKNANGLDRRW